MARQARKRRDRYLRRREQLMQTLVRYGLMPASEDWQKKLIGQDPYTLRTKGIESRLELVELGRALFHLNQRRGFRSNRKADKEFEGGKIFPGMLRLKALMHEAGVRTIGAYLNSRKEHGLSVRARLNNSGVGPQYEFYPERELIEEEFDLLWTTQVQHHPQLTNAAREELHHIIFFQHSRKPVQPGRCPLESTKQRAARALPVAERFRILQEVNQLRIVTPGLQERLLTMAERDIIADILFGGKDLAFSSMRSKLGLSIGHTFNLEGKSQNTLKKDLTAALLSKKDNYGPGWFNLNDDDQERLVLLLLEEESEDLLIQALLDDWGVTPSQACKLAALDLPSGYSRLSRDALVAVTTQLQADIIPFSEAITRAGYNPFPHSHTGERLDRLPYYGIVLQHHVGFGSNHPADRLEERYGRITNPTMHVAFNQVRRVVNELIKDFGHPQQIVSAVARDLKNGFLVRNEIRKRQAEQRQANDRRRLELRKMGIAITFENILRLRLWEDLARDPAKRQCPYTGESISMHLLFSQEIVTEHILPLSRTLDSSPVNMTVCLRRAQRYKQNRTPSEAFGASLDGYSWAAILERAQGMPSNKRWRFSEDALRRYEKDGDFLDRQLSDTHYIARITKEYLSSVCTPRQVWVTPGRLTTLFSRQWGLSRNNRNDYRHHALDAMVIGVTDRRVLQQAVKQGALNVERGASQYLSGLEEPWPGFRTEVETGMEQVIVSHKTDHGVARRLHQETAYGIVGDNGTPNNAQHRVPATAFLEPANLLAVKGLSLRAQMLRAVTDMPLSQCQAELLDLAGLPKREAKERIKSLVPAPNKAFVERLNAFLSRRGIRRVRIIETLSLIPLRDRQGKVYKGFRGASNAYYAISLGVDGNWAGAIVSTFEANDQRHRALASTEELPLVTRLFKNDMMEIEEKGVRKIVYAVKLSEGKIVLAEHFEANLYQRAQAGEFKYIVRNPTALGKSGARPISVSPTGKVRYLESLPSIKSSRKGNEVKPQLQDGPRCKLN